MSHSKEIPSFKAYSISLVLTEGKVPGYASEIGEIFCIGISSINIVS